MNCCRLGIWAAEEIARKAFGVEIAKELDPLNPLDFVTISVRLARALRGVVKGAEAAALKSAIQTLDVDWANISAEQKKQIVLAARNQIAATANAVERAEQVLSNSATKVASVTRAATVDRHGLKITKDLTDWDRQTVELLRASQMVYIKDEYGRRADLFDRQAKEVVASGLERGLGRDDISEALSTKLAESQINRSKNYWDLVATDFANKSRTSTQLSAFGDAKIQNYRFEAVMDEVTSSICRMLHGKVFSVPVAAQQMREAMSLDDPERIRDVRPWVQAGVSNDGDPVLYFSRNGRRKIVADIISSGEGEKNDRGEFKQRMDDAALEAAGISVPPLHGHCRSTIVARD